ncbi:MAG: DUF3592 domain-containing protein [Myxococcaceae bacterium]|nr:DUF3592 domain-containing protein [Myxococcaceae bacterium]
MTPAPTSASLPPPPRTVEGGPGAAIWVGRLFVLPHTLVGLGLIAGCLFLGLQHFFASPVVAQVVDAYTPDPDAATPRTYVTVAYTAWGTEQTNSFSLPPEKLRTLLDAQLKPLQGATLTLRRFGIGPAEVADLPGEDSWLPVLAFLVPFGLFWNGILGTVNYRLWVSPRRRRNLVVRGEATTGTVVSKTRLLGRRGARTYRLRLKYLDREGGDHEVDDTARDEAAFDALSEGGSVTVLFDPERPARALAYESCEYRVAP